MAVHGIPPGPLPSRTWCGLPECSHLLRLTRQRRPILSNALQPQYMNVVGLHHAVPKAQYTVVTFRACVLCSASLMQGHKNKRLPLGFSKDPAIPSAPRNVIIFATHTIKMLDCSFFFIASSEVGLTHGIMTGPGGIGSSGQRASLTWNSKVGQMTRTQNAFATCLDVLSC